MQHVTIPVTRERRIAVQVPAARPAPMHSGSFMPVASFPGTAAYHKNSVTQYYDCGVVDGQHPCPHVMYNYVAVRGNYRVQTAKKTANT